MSYDRAALLAELRAAEGTGPMKHGRHQLYRDSVGLWTIGYGRNIQERGLSPAEAMVCLTNDVADAEADCDRFIPWWRTLGPARQAALVELMFNMGWGNGARGLSTFVNTLRALEQERFGEAAEGLRGSKWARQVGRRAARIIAQIETGP